MKTWRDMVALLLAGLMFFLALVFALRHPQSVELDLILIRFPDLTLGALLLLVFACGGALGFAVSSLLQMRLMWRLQQMKRQQQRSERAAQPRTRAP